MCYVQSLAPKHRTENGKEGIIRSRVTGLEMRIGELARELKRLTTLLDVKNNWHSETHDWVGREVQLKLKHQDQYFQGTLKWIDKYNLALILEMAQTRTYVFNKSAIAFLFLTGEPVETDGE